MLTLLDIKPVSDKLENHSFFCPYPTNYDKNLAKDLTPPNYDKILAQGVE